MQFDSNLPRRKPRENGPQHIAELLPHVLSQYPAIDTVSEVPEPKRVVPKKSTRAIRKQRELALKY